MFPVLEFPSTMFTVSQGVLYAEASDMGNRHLQRLFDDSMDLGFKVRSAKTDKVVTYVFEREVYDTGNEPDLLGWTFLPSNESIREVPECANTRAVVYND